ncbi:hypothetical protein A2U01_0051604, partial [Trifolium medium]|nr:hypothetical protein [Trifolium medium]
SIRMVAGPLRTYIGWVNSRWLKTAVKANDVVEDRSQLDIGNKAYSLLECMMAKMVLWLPTS